MSSSRYGLTAKERLIVEVAIALMFQILTHHQEALNTLETKQVYAAEMPEEVKVLSVEEIILKYAKEYEVDPDVALAVADCESSLNPKALGDSGHSRGIWQIHKPSHPTVTDAVAYSPELSTKWAMPKLKATPKIWTCYRVLYPSG